MNKIIKSTIVPFLCAIILGAILGRYVFKIYQNDIYNDLRSSRIYLIENGEYDNYDTMREENMGNNYVYYKDTDKYKTVVGITRNYDNIDKIKELYSGDLEVMEYYITLDDLDSRQSEYDKMLLETNDKYKVREVVDDILELYKSDDNIRLIQMN